MKFFLKVYCTQLCKITQYSGFFFKPLICSRAGIFAPDLEMRKPRPEIVKTWPKLKPTVRANMWPQLRSLWRWSFFQLFTYAYFQNAFYARHWVTVVRKTSFTHEVDGLWRVTIIFHKYLISISFVYRSVCPLE